MFQLPGCLVHDALTGHGWNIVHSYTRLIVDLDAADTAVIGASAASPAGIRVRAAGDSPNRSACMTFASPNSAGRCRMGFTISPATPAG